MKIKKEDILPNLSNAENARRLKVDPTTVSKARQRLNIPASPLTKTKLPEVVKVRRAERKLARSYAFRRGKLNQIDWRMSNLELSLRHGMSVSQVIRWRATTKTKVKARSKREDVERIIGMGNKLAERKTVHGWLNDLGIPTAETTGKPMCLLRRLAVALNIQPHAA